MNRRHTTIRKPAGVTALLIAGVLGLVAQPAAAHKVDFRPPISHHYYYQHGAPFVFPRWLRKDYDFQRWYLHSDYRYVRGANWHRLYEMYRHDVRYRRYRHRHDQRRTLIDVERHRYRRW